MPWLKTTCYGCDRSYCHRCGASAEIDEDNVHYCSGCEEAICCDCDVNASLPFGGHEPDDHLEEEEDEEGW